MQYQYLEMIAKEPTTFFLILWYGLTGIMIFGAIALFVYLILETPKLWILKKFHKGGKEYQKERRLAYIYLIYFVMSFITSLILFKKGYYMYPYISITIYFFHFLFGLWIEVIKPISSCIGNLDPKLE